ncbi:MAG: bifunctional DNA-formamidopyrimidine glycosylase/DNA-(apurinic or apyrimidinic site) lyase [Desulfobulbus sp.]|jgi:formamidopyrimidine-DNA glycosylase
MPELPEVEVTRRGLLHRLSGRTILQVGWSGKRLRTALPRTLLRRHLTDGRIRTIDRRAKYLLIRMEDGAVLVLHLGMTGRCAVLPETTLRHKHDHLFLLLDNDMEFRFNDSRRFGSVALWPPAQALQLEESFSNKEGIEPLGEDFSPERLLALAGKRTIPIKTFLMNSRIIAGIGNIYANEILFACQINPLHPASGLTPHHWHRIVEETRRILHQAIEAGGSSISDFLGTSGQPGYFQLQLKAYGRTGEPCPECSTALIKTVLSGRATYHCPVCQQAP